MEEDKPSVIKAIRELGVRKSLPPAIREFKILIEKGTQTNSIEQFEDFVEQGSKDYTSYAILMDWMVERHEAVVNGIDDITEQVRRILTFIPFRVELALKDEDDAKRTVLTGSISQMPIILKKKYIALFQIKKDRFKETIEKLQRTMSIQTAEDEIDCGDMVINFGSFKIALECFVFEIKRLLPGIYGANDEGGFSPQVAYGHSYDEFIKNIRFGDSLFDDINEANMSLRMDEMIGLYTGIANINMNHEIFQVVEKNKQFNSPIEVLLRMLFIMDRFKYGNELWQKRVYAMALLIVEGICMKHAQTMCLIARNTILGEKGDYFKVPKEEMKEIKEEAQRVKHVKFALTNGEFTLPVDDFYLKDAFRESETVVDDIYYNVMVGSQNYQIKPYFRFPKQAYVVIDEEDLTKTPIDPIENAREYYNQLIELEKGITTRVKTQAAKLPSSKTKPKTKAPKEEDPKRKDAFEPLRSLIILKIVDEITGDPFNTRRYRYKILV